MKRDFDVVVIGSGPGGYVAAIRAAQLGLKVACIEKSSTLGGTCLNVGCIPSKALLQSTESYEWIQKSAKDHGISASNVQIDLAQLMQRKLNIVKLLVDSIATHFKRHHISWLRGTGRLIDPYTIEVKSEKEQRVITSDHLILATGSEPIGLPFLPFDEKQIVSSTGALSLTSVPKNFVVIGGGAIGVELASVYRRLGSSVTIVEMLNMITPAMDLTISKTLLQSLKKQGIEFLLGAKVAAAKKDASGSLLTVEHEQNKLDLPADVVLVSIGRRPYTQGLGLDAINIKLTPKGFVAIDSNFRTTFPHIFAIGDLVDGPMLAHRATHEGIAVAELIAGMASKVDYLAIPNVVYTHPEMASVGFTEAEAQAAGLQLLIGTCFFRANARARCSGDIDGLVKVIGEATSRRLVGMHIVGPHASELIAEGMIALNKRATLDDLAKACHAHPTLSEAVMEACQGALGYAIHG